MNINKNLNEDINSKDNPLSLNIVNLFPNYLNLYSDIGNLLSLVKRCNWMSINTNIIEYNGTHSYDLNEADIILMNHGSKKSIEKVYGILEKKTEELINIIESDTVFLAIDGSYSLIGNNFFDFESKNREGLGIIDIETKKIKNRILGNSIIENNLNLNPADIVGFENHDEIINHNFNPLGYHKEEYSLKRKHKLLDYSKQSNSLKNKLNIFLSNSKIQSKIENHNFKNEIKKRSFKVQKELLKEGVVYKNCFGTYLHGPLLPKNYQLADEIINRALKRKYNLEISSLDNIIKDNEIEENATLQVKELYFPNTI